jgi:hypothetical protein
MKLKFDAQTRVEDLNTIFQNRFPYLKLCFYKSDNFALDDQTYCDEYTLLIDVEGILREGELEIFPDGTAEDFQALVKEKFWLTMKLCRRMNHSWTSIDNNSRLTLEELNQLGDLSYHQVPEYFIM